MEAHVPLQSRPETLDVDMQEAACSVSESLAHGLVSRLTGLIQDIREHLDARVSVPELTVKRAAGFRALKSYLHKSIPAELVVAVNARGDQSGKSKDASYTVVHWGMIERAYDQRPAAPDALELVITGVFARQACMRSRKMCTVTRHAIMRTFFRLRTLDPSEVMDELHELGRGILASHQVIDRMSWECQLLIPTRRGAFVLVRDRDGSSDFAAITWMSDERMQDNLRRQRAVVHARQDGGVVVNHPQAFPIIRKPWVADGFGESIAKQINRQCDSFYDDRSRLPAEWRFHEPHLIPDGSRATTH